MYVLRMKIKWAIFIVCLLVSLVVGYGLMRDSRSAVSVDAFIAGHWQRPIAAQGAVPEGFTPREGSLAPADCGSCHPRQWEDWQNSLHSRTVGAGLMWQLHLMNQQQANRCLDCHAPLAEQKALLAMRFAWPGAPSAPVPAYVPDDLDTQGLICAACHVRKHQHFGPPPRGKPAAAPLPHGGFTAHEAFSDSRFCAACHQFPEDGPRVNGKLQEDTYAQWLASPAAAAGRQCQDCHMPDRRHLWRGIHDPEMVRGSADADLALTTVDGRTRVTALLSNRDVGHLFPTYMVPKVVMTLRAERKDGEVKTLAQSVIGWQVNVDLNREIADNRIAPGDSHRLEAWLDDEVESVVLDVDVIPREHYERMFEQMLEQADSLPEAALDQLKTAYAEARATRYRLLSHRRPVVVQTGIAN